MTMIIHAITFFCIILVINCKDILVQINSKRVISTISENFIQYSIDSRSVLNGLISNIKNNSTRKGFLSPTVLRLNFQPELLYNLAPDEIESGGVFGNEELKVLNEWANQNGMSMIVRINYDPKDWNQKESVQLLESATLNQLGNCSWQLGDAMQSWSVKQYIKDFKSLQAIAPRSDNFWLELGSFNRNLTLESTTLVLDTFKGDVKEVSYKKSIESLIHSFQFLNKDLMLKILLKSKVPVTLIPEIRTIDFNSGFCNIACIQDALLWSQLVGESAQMGIHSIVKPLEKTDILNKMSFKYLVNHLFEQLVGTHAISIFTGFDKDVKSYSFCSTKLDYVVMMVINLGLDSVTLQVKALSKVKGSVYEYIISTCDGKACLNQNKPDLSTLDPITLKDGSRFTVPELSVAFYLIPDTLESSSCKKSSKNILNLKKSLSQTFYTPNTQEVIRKKRHMNFHDIFKLRPLRHERDRVPLLTKARIPGIEDFSSSNEEVFKSKEDKDFPDGEMHLPLANSPNEEEGDYDYVQFDTTPKPRKSLSKKVQKVKAKPKLLEASFEDSKDNTRDDIEELDFGDLKIIPKAKLPKIASQEIEMEVKKTKSANPTKQPATQLPKEKVKYAVLVKESPISKQQNQENMMKVQQKLKTLQFGQKDSTSTEIAKPYHETALKVDDSKSKRESELNQIEDETVKEEEEFMRAFKKLLTKMGKLFDDESEEEPEDSDRKRREVSHVHIPRRRMRKDVPQKKGKKVKKYSPIKPVDIEDILFKEPKNNLRSKRAIVIDSTNFPKFLNNEIKLSSSEENFEVRKIVEEDAKIIEENKSNLNKGLKLFNFDFIHSLVDPFLKAVLTVKNNTIKFFNQ